MKMIGMIIMSRGKITHETKFHTPQEADIFLDRTFSDYKVVRANKTEIVLKSGNEPINIIIAPFTIGNHSL